MNGRILELAKREARRAVNSLGFEQDIRLLTPDETIEISLKGLFTKHHISFDTDGGMVNSQNSHICLSEKDLIDLSFPHRNSSNKVSLLKCKVFCIDSSENEKKYIIKKNFPDETLGLIVCILSEY